MTRHSLIAPVVLAVLSSASPDAVLAQSASNTPSAPPNPPTANAPSSGMQIQAFLPGLDDLMTMLVQPRHVRLYYAGIGNNWELAAAEVQNLRSAFRRIADTVPTYLNRGLDEAVTAMMTPRLQAVDTAIAAGDAKRFTRAYSDLTTACNACHAYLEHPFLVIKVPDSQAHSTFPDQDFNPSP